MFFISNYRCVLNVVFFLLGDSPASEFYKPTFWEHSVCSLFVGGVRRKLKPPLKMRLIVPKRPHIKFILLEITHKKEYNKSNVFRIFHELHNYWCDAIKRVFVQLTCIIIIIYFFLLRVSAVLTIFSMTQIQGETWYKSNSIYKLWYPAQHFSKFLSKNCYGHWRFCW
jgi:hypothetical protein